MSGIVFVNRNELRWCDALRESGLYKTLYNRWGERGVVMDEVMDWIAIYNMASFDAGVYQPDGLRTEMACPAN